MDLSGKTILLTGGTGSFGRKFAEVVLNECNPQSLRVYSRGEHKQVEMEQRFQDKRLRFLIGDVRDRERLYRAMSGVDVVVHAAALKHVPLAEYNPMEAVKTNIHGAENVIDAAIDNGVERVLALSTDKAVHPVNLYGATKLVAEKMFVQGNAYAGGKPTRISCVRYGNVVGSQGSVIPLFLKQRENGKITVTDSRMTRFWITLEGGVRFVLNCIERMEGGEIFVPKIPSMRLMDLAEAIAPEAEKETIGIRPGEKLHEVLVSEDESRHTLELDDMFVIQPRHPWWKGDGWRDAEPMTEEDRYTSDTNDDWLDVERLDRMLEAWRTHG